MQTNYGLLLVVTSLLFNVSAIHLKLNEGTTDKRKRERVCTLHSQVTQRVIPRFLQPSYANTGKNPGDLIMCGSVIYTEFQVHCQDKTCLAHTHYLYYRPLTFETGYKFTKTVNLCGVQYKEAQSFFLRLR